MADREESCTITRAPSGVQVKVTLKEQGCTVNYTIKPMGSNITLAVQEARAGAEGYLKQAIAAAP